MTFHVHTYGCQMNVRDTEAIGTLLEDCGHEQAESEDSADLVIVNTCCVREKAEDKALGKLGLLCASKRKRPDRVIGAVGCMVQRLQENLFELIPELDFALGTRSAALLPSVLNRVLAGEGPCGEWNVEEETTPEADRRDILTGHSPGQTQAFITILLGCERRCSYCIVPDVRGNEYSRPARAVLDEVRQVVKDGSREITLLGQSVMRYGLKNEVWPVNSRSPAGYAEPLPRLFEAMALENPALYRIRFTSSHPGGVTAELVRAMVEIPALCPHLHLPVQSGSDRILARMRRGYTSAGYLKAVEMLRNAIPDLALTTDVIVGFPGETEEDFLATSDLLEQAQIDNTFIFKYSPRPGTPAAEWHDDVPEEEKMRRNQVLLQEQDRRGLELNRRWIGRRVEVLVEGVSLRNPKRWSGRTPQNKIVVFEPDSQIRPGDLVQLKIKSARPQTLAGEWIK